MKNIVIITLFAILLPDSKNDTLNSNSEFNLFKDISIPGLIPKDLSYGRGPNLVESEMDEIKRKALNFEPSPVLKDDVVIMKTSLGKIKIKLFPNIAPKHCKNFKKLANSGYYDKTKFHRIIPGFMIQGGDLNSRDNNPKNDGQGGPGWTVDAEFSNIPHKRGTVSMARSSNPNSAGSQFFICVADAPHLDGKYSVFGEVIENIHVVDHIVNSPTEYIQAKRMSRETIPKGEDPDHWITLKDPKTGKKLYSKVPNYKKKTDFEYEMKHKIKSDNPSLPLIIKEIRVKNMSELIIKDKKL